MPNMSPTEVTAEHSSRPFLNSSWNITSVSSDNLSSPNFSRNECMTKKDNFYLNSFGISLALPEWEAIITTLLLSIIIVLTIVGNILVILSVFTYKPLRIVQNFFIVSLAVADLTVALLVLPFNVAYSVLGQWEFGIHMCKLWLTCDVMCCTSSILNLCAIALDRFWAITDPINYVHKRTVNRVLLQITGVWVVSFLISSPPLMGWNDWPEEFTSSTPCELTSNRGYVIYSSLGSFFIPLIIMTIVYIEIYIASRKRLRERNLASKMYQLSLKPNNIELGADNWITHKKERPTSSCSFLKFCTKNPESLGDVIVQSDLDSISSESKVKSDINKAADSNTCTETIQSQESTQAKVKSSVRFFYRDDSSDIKSSSKKNRTYNLNNTFKSTKNIGTNTIMQNIKYEEGEDEKCNDEYNDDENITVEESNADILTTREATTNEKTKGFHQFIEEKQKISLSKERRAARTLGIIMGVFVFCWLPFFLMYVILPFCDTCCPSQKLKNFITWLGYINSSLNPVIYTIFNLDYRRAFKRLLGIHSN